MARKRLQILLLWCVSLSLLPGCQHFHGLGSADGEDPRPRGVSVCAPAASDLSVNPVPESKGVSPPIAQEAVPCSQCKKQANPLPDVIHGLDKVPDAPGRNKLAELSLYPKLEIPLSANEVKPSDTGQPGGVTGESHRLVAEPVKTSVTNLQVSQPPVLQPVPLPENKKPEKRAYAPFLKALQCMLEERHQEALQHLRAYDPETEEFFLRLAPTLIMLVKKPLDELSPPEVAVLSDQLSSILVMLRPRSELGINKMCYCRRIDTFGSMVPLPDHYAFLAKSGDRLGEQVQLYVELKNFASEPKEGQFLTKLACTLELRDTTGKTVWSFAYPRRETTHRRQSRLNDFYSNFSFYVPEIPPGAYLLTIQIADETNPELRRVARKSLDFRVTPSGGQSSLR